MANSKQSPEEFITIKDLLLLCAGKWYWFIISLVITLSIAVLYIKKTPPVYTRTALLMIKNDSQNKAGASDMEAFSDLGIFQSNTNVNNEIISLQSPSLMYGVVKRLHLETEYSTEGTFYNRTIYGSSLPVNVTFLNVAENEAAGFTIQLHKDSTFTATNFTLNNEELPATSITGALQDTLSTPIGNIIVAPSPYYRDDITPVIYVNKIDSHSAVGQYSAKLSVALNDEKSSIIQLTYNDVSTQRAEDVLNTLIAVYNENWVKDKNQIAVSTSMFINERLAVIEQELGNVDEDISSYKSKNLLPDVQAASSLYMTQSSQANSQLQLLNNQLYMARYIRNYITSAPNKNQLLPANSGIESASIENQISEYNTVQLQRNNLVANSSEQNPLVIDLDQSLASLREAIISSIDNLVVTLNSQIKNLQQGEQQITARIAANPTQAKYLLSVERQQKVKESLYLYLLQKREENELSQAFTAYNTRIVTPPMGSNIPTAPLSRNILLVAFAIGLLIPTIAVYLIELMNTTVRGRKDLEGMTVPFIGEIPLSYRKKRHFIIRRKVIEKQEIVVQDKNRNMINEAFRIIRTKIEFIVGKNAKSPVIMITSANPGSGKTFITINLATSFAIKGKKVLAIDMDMRKASLSEYVYSPKTGLSHFLNNSITDIHDIIIKGKTHPNLDILPVGVLPPNPTELLMEEQLGTMLAMLRNEYDYIFIDCPPVEIVADTAIITRLVDATLFVVRAEVLERSMLPEIEQFYTEHKYKNMSLILNGTSNSNGRYGYRYGYNYGYGSSKYYNEE